MVGAGWMGKSQCRSWISISICLYLYLYVCIYKYICIHIVYYCINEESYQGIFLEWIEKNGFLAFF